MCVCVSVSVRFVWCALVGVLRLCVWFCARSVRASVLSEVEILEINHPGNVVPHDVKAICTYVQYGG